MRTSARITAILAWLAAVLPGAQTGAQTPMSAIDWLSDTIATPVAAPNIINEAAVTSGISADVITVTALDAVSADAVGLLPASVTGLPRGLWGSSASTEIAALIKAVEPRLLPAMQDLLFALLLTELDPPSDSDSSGRLFLARIDKLMELGAVEQAQAMLERAGPDRPESFQRWFDASLLTGTEDAACDLMMRKPDLAPDLPSRIFCLARSGDWNAAALSLESGRALGQFSGAEDAILVRFLDPEIFEGAPPLPQPARPTPLIFRLHEAVGEALPTARLPLAFAQADLRANTGWKAQLEAAERLARHGSLAGNKLLGLYTDKKPAASGGIWDRAAAIRRFDIVLAAGAGDATGPALRDAWRAMESVELGPVFARLYAKRLAEMVLPPDAMPLSFRIGLLSRDFASAARNHDAANAEEMLLSAIALGNISDIVPTGELARAIVDGFQATTAPDALPIVIIPGQIGVALLQAIDLMTEGAKGDLNKLSGAIAVFRAAGMEDVARRAALQVLILDRRG